MRTAAVRVLLSEYFKNYRESTYVRIIMHNSDYHLSVCMCDVQLARNPLKFQLFNREANILYLSTYMST